ncbi:hypothetical protein [Tellurirhabdus bombi]|uniref:hypothetical protein n=1 Tax=Tellurirhabdus bombi TaxID=2907205 RepID=UPI001F37C571|nr:hypothetical protein [Tellurirhabdus bombi]
MLITPAELAWRNAVAKLQEYYILLTDELELLDQHYSDFRREDTSKINNLTRLQQLLVSTLNQLRDEASNGSQGLKDSQGRMDQIELHTTVMEQLAERVKLALDKSKQ